MDRIVCSAIRNKHTGKILCSVRHFDYLTHQFIDDDDTWLTSEQGFVNQRGEFLTREEAWIVATNAGQIIKRVGGDNKKLFSENLY